MYRYKYIGLLLVCMLLSGCADQDTPESTVDELIGVDLSFFVPSPSDVTGLDVASTRMAADVVQLSSTGARELEDVIIIPFKTRGTIGIDDVPSQHLSYSSWQVFPKTKGQFYYNGMCQFVNGVASVLVYGHGASGEEQNYYGSTTANIPPELTPADISFVPTQIRATTAYDDKAEALATYLTDIANTKGWSTTDDSKLKALYLNFIGKKESPTDYKVFAGSSRGILGYVNNLSASVQNCLSIGTVEGNGAEV